MRYIHQHKEWPNFIWDESAIGFILAKVRHEQGRLLGKMESLGFDLRSQADLAMLTLEVVKSSEIEGEKLDAEKVRSSIARKLGLDIAGLVPSERHIDGVVEMMLNATRQYNDPILAERLFGWHASLFPTGYSGTLKITVANWRSKDGDPMQVVSGPIGKERVHFEAPAAEILDEEMNAFFNWFNSDQKMDPVLKSAIAHLWFVTIHPFADGNGRIARAIAELQLARADKSEQRFYSMSAQIRKEREAYYDILEATQSGSLDITGWLRWFLECLSRSIASTEEILQGVFTRSKFWSLHSSVELNTRQRMMIEKMLDDFFGKLNSSKWAKMAKTSNDTALRDLQDLVNKGMLVQEGVGRGTVYRLKEV